MSLEELPNIGPTLATRLRRVGVHTEEDLRRIGPAEVYRRIAAEYGLSRPPLCYNLYSLAAALDGVDWRMLDDRTKAALCREAGVEYPGARSSRARSRAGVSVHRRASRS